MIPFIGLHGRMGSGKDTVYERMKGMFPSKFERVSFADPLKQSAAALFGVSVQWLDEWKRDENVRVCVVVDNGINRYVSRSMLVRTYLQRYGTEAHRDIFGCDFWVDQGMRRAQEVRAASNPCTIPVFTDVRFENEALTIKGMGGEIWHVRGLDEDTGLHASEAPLPVSLIDRHIDNTAREDSFAGLDAQLRAILDDIGVGSGNEANSDRVRGNGSSPAGRD